MNLYKNIYRIVKRIPSGNVTSYGRIAKMLGCSARQVGYAMAAAPAGENIPWHRVVNSKGEISARKHGDGDRRQKMLLIEEGVRFDNDRIDLALYGWMEAELPFIPEQWPELEPEPGSSASIFDAPKR